MKKYHKAFEEWWRTRKNNLGYVAQDWVYDEVKRQCYRAWVAGRTHEHGIWFDRELRITYPEVFDND